MRGEEVYTPGKNIHTLECLDTRWSVTTHIRVYMLKRIYDGLSVYMVEISDKRTNTWRGHACTQGGVHIGGVYTR